MLQLQLLMLWYGLLMIILLLLRLFLLLDCVQVYQPRTMLLLLVQIERLISIAMGAGTITGDAAGTFLGYGQQLIMD